ncbi:hypothetical protein Agub_g5155 [Astrephomene gubernaculifera]|uniref:PUB domain-containing protein n=1 Tax=Astrephomene gubernaculifera TaxID=47775 RepID=A0AAD3DLF3_9CHLO|nr:hypothetical protein Agub_g5155 [Astrephomene gubernaculifera]
MSSLEAQLVAKGVSQDVARACEELFVNLEEACLYALPPLLPGGIREHYSLRHNRYYYHCKATGKTSWEMPPQLQLSEWLLDAATSGLDVRRCRKLHAALLFAINSNAHKGMALWRAAELLSRLTANIVNCGNTVEKYRTVRPSNPKIREALDVMNGGEEVLRAAGFVTRRGAAGAGAGAGGAAGGVGGSEVLLCFPSEGADLRPLTLINAKLQQLVTRKGFTGSAREADDRGDTPASRHRGKPGFVYQEEIVECSCCSRPINDGTDRILTRQSDAPRGEFRYECERCSGFNLCEGCWDKYLAGSLSPPHPRDHPFQTHHPKVNPHNIYSHTSATNPWGVVLAGGSAARARERLKERTGL